MTEPSDSALLQRKARDRAIVVPLLGLMFFMPPIAGAFSLPGTIFGVPVIVVYLFAVWAGLIVHAYFLARALQHAEGHATDTLSESR